jgi:hypothetical protein
LAGIVRELNKTSDIPIFVLFGYGDLLTFAVVDRRPSKQKGQSDRDVLEKVTLVKDIHTRQPHRAHLDILFDLSLPQVLKRGKKRGKVTNFDELHAAWKLVLDTSELNRRFFNELSDWYFWAVDRVEFPDGAETDRDRRNKTSLIRLISRLMFVWFLREKHLVDPALFDRAEVEKLLKSLDPDDSSYYTPREIVSYMVDEALIAHFLNHPRIVQASRVAQASSLSDDGQSHGQDGRATLEGRLRGLFDYGAESPHFSEAEIVALIEAIDTVKVLDPACGSGAFPMGILQRLVFLLKRLDPGNERWKARQIEQAERIPDPEIRDRAIADIEESFRRGNLDYGRKFFLIQNCIYGVDLQPIAVQIAKWRCFISLIVEQETTEDLPNRGILPLPNLETKFVAANTLISLERPGFRPTEVVEKQKELAIVRQKHFTAKTPATKKKYRDRDAELRGEIGRALKSLGLPGSVADSLASWNPYDQEAIATFFAPEWMFDVGNFDIVIGNSPYVRIFASIS